MTFKSLNKYIYIYNSQLWVFFIITFVFVLYVVSFKMGSRQSIGRKILALYN